MSAYISLSAAFAQWQEILDQYDDRRDDDCALAESWNNYTDSLAKDGQLCALQYRYCPAYDDEMPGKGSRWDALSDDREFILDAMKVTLDAEFVPFSQSRNKGEAHKSLNWRVTLKKDGREVITTDYMQGSGHCPADKKTFNTPSRNPTAEKREAIASECETGRIYVNGWKQGAKIAPPDVSDVLHSLLMDASALDAGTFEDWCAEFGFDSDSIKHRAMYDACIAEALKLRAAFGEKTLSELHELFEGM